MEKITFLKKLKVWIKGFKFLKNPTHITRYTKHGKKMIAISEYSPLLFVPNRKMVGVFEVVKEYEAIDGKLIKKDFEYLSKD